MRIRCSLNSITLLPDLGLMGHLSQNFGYHRAAYNVFTLNSLSFVRNALDMEASSIERNFNKNFKLFLGEEESLNAQQDLAISSISI